MSVSLLVVWMVVVLTATALLWYGTGLLEQSSETLSAHYGLPEVVRGTMIVAIGSSFPEFTTVVLSSLLHGDFELGVSAILGSAIFNILVIPSVAAISNDQPLNFNRNLVYKEAQFYIISVALLLLTFSFAVIFRPGFEIVGSGAIYGRLGRGLALLPVALYAMYVFLQYQDASEYNLVNEGHSTNVWLDWGRLILGLLLILGGVEMLLRAALRFGSYLDIPSFFWGVTLVAISTSLPDTMASIRLVSSGNPIASVANVLGSNIFDLLVCVPAGILVAGTTTVNFSLSVPLFGVLTLGTFFLFGLMRRNMVLTIPESWFLLGLYGLFLAWMMLETLGVIDFFAVIP